MSTRSVIALPHGDAWRGRYVHSDGYPTYMGRTLFALVRRDGLDAVIETIVTGEHYGWSSLSATQPVIKGVTPDKEARWGTAGYVASLFSTDDDQVGYYSDGRFANVPNYGIAYTVKGGARANDWHVPDPDAWTEWAYVMTAEGLLVIKQGYGGSPDRAIGLYRWDSEPDWQAIEDSVYASA